MAPEIIRGQRYSKAVDVYSFGLILLEAVLGDAHYVQSQLCMVKPAAKARIAAASGWRPAIPAGIREHYAVIVDLIHDCLLDSFSGRPSFVEITKRLSSYTNYSTLPFARNSVSSKFRAVLDSNMVISIEKKASEVEMGKDN